MSAEKRTSKSLALKLAEARSKIDNRLAIENEVLRQEIEQLKASQQTQRLEGLVEQDAKARKLADQLKENTVELAETRKALKKLQAFDPERQKRQLAEQKKRLAEQATLSKDLNKRLKAATKEVSKLKKDPKEVLSPAP
ncbi:MAG: hypothetical protein V7731_18045 [Amphritea sp.]